MKTLVVLGSGLVGVPIVHHVMKHTVPKVKDLRVIWVTPETDQYWSLASVRGVVPGQMADEKLFTPIAPTIAHYPKDKIELVIGKADTLNPDTNTIIVSTKDGGKRSISYDTLVIGTGTRALEGMPFKNTDSTEGTKEKLHQLQAQIKAAKTIVVAGGGTTGVETVGEIGFEYAQNGQKDVYFIIDKELPLGNAPFTESVRKAAYQEVEKLKIKIITSSKVTSVKDGGPNGQKTLQITKTDGTVQTLKADVYIPATGVLPNTSFAPAHMLDSNGYIKQDTNLQTPGYTNIFVAGDVGNLQPSMARWADLQTQHVAKALQAIFTGAKVADYVIDNKLMAGITVGRSRATGQVNGWRVFSFLIWFAKGRFLGTDYNKDFVAGKRTALVKDW